MTGIGHHIDSSLVADGDGDGLDDLFFMRNGNIISCRGRPQINWIRSPTELSHSADVDSDGIDDFAVGEKLISGRSGKKLWSFPRGGVPLLGDATNRPMNQMPTEQMHLLEHDINKDGFKEVLASGESFPSSGMVGQSHLVRLLSGDDGTVLWKALPSAANKMTFSSALTHVQSEIDSAGKVEITGIVKESQLNGKGHTWLVRLKGNTGETKWKVPLFAAAILDSRFKLVHRDFNNDGIPDILAPSAAKTDSAGVVKIGKLQLRAYDGRDGSLIWEVPVVQLSEFELDSFPTLTVVDTESAGVVVAFYDHRFANGTNASLRVIHGATGQNIGHPLQWTEPMPNPNINEIQLPWPVVIKDRNKGEHFFACSVWTSNPAVTKDWNGRELERGPWEEVLVMNAQGKIVTRFALPPIRGNKFRANRQRVWSHDTNQDGIDELIFLDHAGLTAIDPFNKQRVWSWESPQSMDLRLHAKLERSMKSAIGVVNSDHEAFGIDLSNGTKAWDALAKTSDVDSRNKIHLLNCKDAAPRVLFLNDGETICITSRSDMSISHGEMLPVPLERMSQNDPRNRRYLPWVQGIPFWHATEPVTEALKQIFELLIVLPLLSVFVIFPWFWFKQIIRRRQFTIRSLLLLSAGAALGMLLFLDQGPFPDAFTFSLAALGVSLVAVLPPVVFIYSVVRMLLLGQWKALKWWSAVMFILTLGFLVVAVGIAMMDFAPEEVYWYDYGWTLILWLGYCTGAFLIAFEFARICWIGCRYLASAIRRSPHPPATV